MATVNKKDIIKQQQGLPTKEQIMMSPEVNKDTVPAMLTENEYVFSVPAIIALGEGDYNKGVQMLDVIHEELKETGKSMAGEAPQQGIAGVPME